MREIRFCLHESHAAVIRCFSGVAKPDQYVGCFDEPLRTFDTNGFDPVIGLPKSSSVRQPNRHAGNRDGDFDMIARCSRQIADDRSFFSDYLVD